MEATKKVSGKSAKKWLSENAIIVLMLAVSLIVGIIHPNFFAVANPVSYTHLDVYKRQSYSWAKNASASSGESSSMSCSKIRCSSAERLFHAASNSCSLAARCV